MHIMKKWRLGLIAITGIAAIIAAGLQGPVPQDPAYHRFADQRFIFHIANFWNVVSNLPFLIAGAAGLFAMYRSECPGVLPALRFAYRVFFVGAGLVALGSAYYHFSPNNAALAWDRLAITIAFMAFLAVILGEHISPRLGRLSLVPLVVIGLFSVLVWHMTEARGHGDLRLYILIQYLPMVLIPLIVVLFPSGMNKVYFIWAALFLYALGKSFELLDGPIYQSLHLSGHTLKHLASAIGVFVIVLAVRKRACAAA